MTEQSGRYRTHTCAALGPDHVGQSVRLAGWVNRKRDHGQLLFIDLRDHYGVTQCVVDPDSPAFAQAEKLREKKKTLPGVSVVTYVNSTDLRTVCILSGT